MPKQTFWIIDPDTEVERPISYLELEADILQKYFIQPIGGFIFPADMFLLSRLPAVPFYVKDWLPKRGKSMLFAPTKAGKSFLALQLARCVGAGESFLGLPTTLGKVLYIQFELGEEILQARLLSSKKEYPNVYIGTTFSMKLDSESGQEQLLKAIQAVDPAVVILDPLYKAILGDENESTDVRKILDFLDSIIEDFNCSLFLIHHAGKDLSKRGRGSSVLEDWVDSYIQMQRTSKAGENLKVKIRPIFLRHAPLPEGAILAELGEDFEFHLIGSEPTVKERVAEFVRTKGEITPKQVFEQGIGSNTSVYEALEKLREEGKVRKPKRGIYCWNL